MSGVFDGSTAASVAWQPFTDDSASFGLSLRFKPHLFDFGSLFIIEQGATGLFWLLGQLNDDNTFGTNIRGGGTQVETDNATGGGDLTADEWHHLFVYFAPATNDLAHWVDADKTTATINNSIFSHCDTIRFGNFSASAGQGAGGYTGSLYQAVLFKGISIPTDDNIADMVAGDDPETVLGETAIGRWNFDSADDLLADSAAGAHDLTATGGTVTYSTDDPSFGETFDAVVASAGSGAGSGTASLTLGAIGAGLGDGTTAGTVTISGHVAQSTGRSLTTGATAAIVASPVQPAILMEGEFASGTVYMWTGVGTLTWNGQDWQGGGQFIELSQIDEGEELTATSVAVTISGIPEELISTALQETQSGAVGHLYLALFDSAGAIIADPYEIFRGRLSVPTITDDGTTATIQISYDNLLVDLFRKRTLRYTNAQQQALYPGDLGLEYDVAMASKSVQWGPKVPS